MKINRDSHYKTDMLKINWSLEKNLFEFRIDKFREHNFQLEKVNCELVNAKTAAADEMKGLREKLRKLEEEMKLSENEQKRKLKQEKRVFQEEKRKLEHDIKVSRRTINNLLDEKRVLDEENNSEESV